MSTRTSTSKQLEKLEDGVKWVAPTPMDGEQLFQSPNESQAPTEEKGWNSGTPPNDEEAATPSAKQTAGAIKDPNLVDWLENDKGNPRNWSNGRKSIITLQLSILAFAASLGSSITAPAEIAIADYVGVSREVSVLSISLYM